MDPVFYKSETWRLEGQFKELGWYFWDETWSDCYGPFGTETECRTTLTEYAKKL